MCKTHFVRCVHIRYAYDRVAEHFTHGNSIFSAVPNSFVVTISVYVGPLWKFQLLINTLLFTFASNLADASDIFGMEIFPPFHELRIGENKKKGGRERRDEDLKKIYMMKEGDLKEKKV